jgi:hypothetical protein
MAEHDAHEAGQQSLWTQGGHANLHVDVLVATTAATIGGRESRATITSAYE